MKALNSLRHLAVLLLFALAAATASAAPGDADTKKVRKTADRPAVERTVKPQRKQVAAFADPSLPLAEFVERVRAEQVR